MKVLIEPHFDPVDKGDGGIRRVVEAQRKYLPMHGVEIVDEIAQADVVAMHASLYQKTDKPIVQHCHGLYWKDYEWSNWCYSLNREVIDALLKADAITVPSEWVANIVHRALWKPATVLYHGIDTKLWSPGINEGYVLWNKTRIDPICDAAPLVELAERAGGTQFVTTYGLEAHNVKSTGVLPFDSARALIANAGVYLCTTRETFGIGTLEAMACGVPILGFNWGGQREVITHKENGYLVRPYDYDALTEGLEYCLTHRDSLGRAGRDLVIKSFDWYDVMGKYADLYAHALTSRVHRGPRVSIIIPCYNMKQYLSDAVRSVTAQDYDDWEIIIVDDASTDGSGALADSFASDKIHVVHNKENQYLAGALNTGIAASSGSYIVPLDADNMLGEHALRTLSEHLDAHRESDIVYGKMEIIEDDGKRWISDWPHDFTNYEWQFQHGNQCPSTSMYRREVWQQTGGYRTRCRTAEDADFWTRAFSISKRAEKVTEAVTLIYRNRQNSMSHQEADWGWHLWSNPNPWMLTDRNISTYEPTTISVVIPVGPGHAARVIDAIDSLAIQTMDNWEVLVVDDHIEDYWLPPFVRRFHTNSPGSGPAVARNIGIDNARGTHILFLDADDYLQPEALQLMYEALDGGDGYSYCDWFIAETGELHETQAYDCYQLLREMQHSVTMLVPKSDVRFDESLDAWEDWDYCLQLAEKGICGIRVPIALLNYRIHSGGRRETLYARKEQLKQNIFNKWRKYMIGEDTLMGCSCQSVSAPTPGPAMLNVSTEGMTLLAYNAPGKGTRTYTGKATGTPYRFGDDDDHNMKYVYDPDVPFFLSLSEFDVANKSTTKVGERLIASGAPSR